MNHLDICSLHWFRPESNTVCLFFKVVHDATSAWLEFNGRDVRILRLTPRHSLSVLKKWAMDNPGGRIKPLFPSTASGVVTLWITAGRVISPSVQRVRASPTSTIIFIVLVGVRGTKELAASKKLDNEGIASSLSPPEDSADVKYFI